MSYSPLEGVRVLDLTRMIGGALATLKLADFGADVVKVEAPPYGDYARTIAPLHRDESFFSWTLNRGKKSIALDLKQPGDRETFARLAEVADVIVEVSTPGTFQKLGIDFAQMRRDRPELVVCSMSAFGQTGPLAALPAHGMSIDALAGAAPLIQRDGRWHFEPDQPWALGLELGGINASLAIVAALLGARTTGRGAWIDIGFWDAAVELRRNTLARRLTMGELGWLPTYDDPLYGIYTAADGRLIMFAAQERKFLTNFCTGVDRPDLLDGWESDGMIAAGARWLRDELDRIFATRNADEWLECFVAWDVPGAVVMTEDELPAMAHTRERGLISERWAGDVPMIHSPIRWMADAHEDAAVRPGQDSPPGSAIGADTEAVLAAWLDEAPGSRRDIA